MIEQLFESLGEQGVRYVLVGGMALNLHGIPRSTYDIDLAVDLERENLSKFWDACARFGFTPRAPITKEQWLDPQARQGWIEEKNVVALTFLTEKPFRLEMDVLIALKGITFERLLAGAVRRPLGKHDIFLAGKDALIQMKLASGRDQDLRDVEYLRSLQ